MERYLMTFRPDRRLNNIIKNIADKKGRTCTDIRLELIYYSLDSINDIDNYNNVLTNKKYILSIINLFSKKYKENPTTMRIPIHTYKTILDLTKLLTCNVSDITNLLCLLPLKTLYPEYNLDNIYK